MNFFKNRTVLGIISIVLSLIICFAVVPFFNREASHKTQIVRVTKDIRAGEIITGVMIDVVEVGAYNLPDNVIRNTEMVIGKYATAALSAGDYILNAKLSDAPALENAYLYNLDGSKQAISVTVRSLATGLSGKLRPGDIVSVIAPDYKKLGTTVIPPELQYVKVIAVTASSGEDTNTDESAAVNDPDSDEKRELLSTVTLLAHPEQAKLLADLEAGGDIHLALVYRGMSENAALFLAAQDEVIESILALLEEEADDKEETLEEASHDGESQNSEEDEGGEE